MVFGGLFAAVDFSSAQTWTQASSPAGGWTSFVVSVDGGRLLASGVDGNLYTSTNSGATWTLQTNAPHATNNWLCFNSSADGTKLLALNYDSDALYASTNSGYLWMDLSNAPVGIVNLAASADGATIAAIVGLSTIYISTNSGVTWAQPVSPPIVSGHPYTIQQLRSLTASADGTKLVASAELNSGGIVIDPQFDLIGLVSGIFASTNSGTTWEFSTYRPEYDLSSVACSANGGNVLLSGQAYFNFILKHIVPAGQYWFYQNYLGYPVCRSSDSGVNWSVSWNDPQLPSPVLSNGSTTPNPNPFNYRAAYLEVDFVASDAAGDKCAALDVPDGLVYVSTDSGATWPQQFSTPSGDGSWNNIAISADGNKIILGSSAGGIYTLQTTPSPLLNLASSNGSLAFSWTVPSTNLVLQQNLDLTTTNWVTLTNTPTLIFSNLQYQVGFLPTNSRCFFRLTTQ
jgi:photosystem II stability/assembly factor-like uncharacterized protein